MGIEEVVEHFVFFVLCHSLYILFCYVFGVAFQILPSHVVE